MLLDFLPLFDGSAYEPPVISQKPHWGNALGIVFTKPTFIETATCRCIAGKPPIKACDVHCHVIYARQAVEDELVTLSLV